MKVYKPILNPIYSISTSILQHVYLSFFLEQNKTDRKIHSNDPHYFSSPASIHISLKARHNFLCGKERKREREREDFRYH